MKKTILFILVLAAVCLCVAGSAFALSDPIQFGGASYQIGNWVKESEPSNGQMVYYLQILQTASGSSDSPLVWVRFNNGSFDVEALSASYGNYYRSNDLLSFKYKIKVGEALPVKGILYDPESGKETELDLSGCKVDNDWMKYPVEPLSKSANVGDVVTFGSYVQDSTGLEEKTPIEWYVMENLGGKMLLFSRENIDAKAYETNAEALPITWDECAIRTWLNSEFLETAFNEKERGQIAATQVVFRNGSQKSWTLDRVFLFSKAELEQYFKEDSERRGSPTDYAAGIGLYPECYWYRADDSDFRDYKNEIWINFIDSQGLVKLGRANYEIGVRPSIWVSVK